MSSISTAPLPVVESLQPVEIARSQSAAAAQLELGGRETASRAIERALPAGASAASRLAALRAVLADYAELTKLRISVMVLVTVAVAAFVGNWGPPPPGLIVQTLLGTALVAASASALNQRLERRTDALMPRTAQRPLPAGRISDRAALRFGVLTIVVGLAWLATAVNPATAALGALTWLLYVAVYTPLKTRTPLNTVVGAVAGALPTLMGWTAVGGSLNLTGGGQGLIAATLFLIVYLWQFPHFMAIAWIYRRQYAGAGLKMLTVVDPSGRRAAGQAVAAALALLAISLVPLAHFAGWIYCVSAVVLGSGYLAASIRFGRRRDEASARVLLAVSLVYLPVLLVLLMFVPLI